TSIQGPLNPWLVRVEERLAGILLYKYHSMMPCAGGDPGVHHPV
ncbi:MAG: hypothetical protein ACI8RW_001510, partial [Porticoccaceae bacterium]